MPDLVLLFVLAVLVYAIWEGIRRVGLLTLVLIHLLALGPGLVILYNQERATASTIKAAAVVRISATSARAEPRARSSARCSIRRRRCGPSTGRFASSQKKAK